MKIAREIKKQEAIKRLNTMNIIEDAINQFIDDDIVMVSDNPFGMLYWLNDDYKKLVAEFEAEYNGLVYIANYCVTEFGRLLSLFYVSDYDEEWVMDNEDIAEGYAMVYCINLDCPDFSEFGSIAYESINGGIKRIG
jgi:hypothetical protein